MAGKPRKYAGVLAKPIHPIRKPGDTVDAEKWIVAEKQRITGERADKIIALSEFHGVDMLGSNFQGRLLWALIDAHVPGFRVAEARGRGQHKKYTIAATLALIADIVTVMEIQNCDAAHAFRFIAERDYPPGPRRERAANSLRKRLSDARKIPLVRQILATKDGEFSSIPARAWRQAADENMGLVDPDRRHKELFEIARLPGSSD